jgi:hypothetical protein
MVSPGVKPEEARKIGFRYARTAQEALGMAFEKQGPDASVAVVRYGGHVLPIIDDEAVDRIADKTTREVKQKKKANGSGKAKE